MSLDRRLRQDLQRDADRVQVDIDRNLGAVEARSRHRDGPGLSLALVAAAAITLVIGIRVAAPPSIGAPTPSPSMSGTAGPGYAAIAGLYRVSLEAGLPVDDVSGTWTMRLGADGELALTPPATFADPSLAPTGVGYSIDGGRFRTDLFYNDYCRSVGTYTWSRTTGRLTLVPVEDDCPIRRALLATAPWTELP